MFKVVVRLAAVEELSAILDRTTGSEVPRAAKTLDAAGIGRLKALVRAVPIASPVKEYVAKLIHATHPDSPLAPPEVRKYRAIRQFAPRRAGHRAGRQGRRPPQRAGQRRLRRRRRLTTPALRHRLILSFEGQADGVAADEIVARTIAAVPRPTE